jgi:hypothetical protein
MFKTDTRHKNVNWTLPTDPQNGRIQTWQAVEIAVMMDIRDELQTLNGLLRCPNFVEIPRTLRAIKRNTSKRKRAR